MSKRSEHTFQFMANHIREAATKEADYHEQRERWWRDEQERAAAAALKGAGIEVKRFQATGGEQLSFVIKFGDAAEARRTTEAFQKAEDHRQAKERFLTDAQVYGSQDSTRIYELDTDDVHHFRLGGQARDE